MSGSYLDLFQQNVMIVDDNRHMRALLCSIFRALNITSLKEVRDGETVLIEVESFEPTLIVTDWHMEPMDGIALVKSIRHFASSLVKYVPIIMLTGHSDLQRVQEARPAAITDIYTRALDLKGQGGGFGYDLITAIGDLLTKFLEGKVDLSPRDFDILNAHVDAMQAVLRAEMKGRWR